MWRIHLHWVKVHYKKSHVHKKLWIRYKGLWRKAKHRRYVHKKKAAHHWKWTRIYFKRMHHHHKMWIHWRKRRVFFWRRSLRFRAKALHFRKVMIMYYRKYTHARRISIIKLIHRRRHIHMMHHFRRLYRKHWGWYKLLLRLKHRELYLAKLKHRRWISRRKTSIHFHIIYIKYQKKAHWHWRRAVYHLKRSIFLWKRAMHWKKMMKKHKRLEIHFQKWTNTWNLKHNWSMYHYWSYHGRAQGNLRASSLAASMRYMELNKWKMYTHRSLVNKQTIRMYAMLYKKAKAKARSYHVAAVTIWKHTKRVVIHG